MTKLTTKIADQDWEFEEICKLNHETFSEEIPQHQVTENGLLVDKFHSENQYIICLHEQELIGMIALRSNRPFSLDAKIDNLDNYLPPHKSLCEIRLLVVKPAYRGTRAFYALYKRAFAEFVKNKYDYAVMSGILAQQKLYKSIGFVPFAHVVGELVKFQPMYSCPNYFFHSRHKQSAFSNRNKVLNLLPGPVNIKEIIAEEFKNAHESHRSPAFKDKYTSITKALCNFVNAEQVQILNGSGTLANEVMLAHLSTLAIKGLILSNGEFGNRIIHQANCHKLDFIAHKIDYGNEFSLDDILRTLNNNEIKWLFFVHCETSTGILNNFEKLIKICTNRGIYVLVDCISTFGIIPLDLSTVYMASASSGKALGSYAGLSMIFHKNMMESAKKTIPVYLDLRHYISKKGIPFTLNSNALYALGTALDVIDIHSKYHKIKELGTKVRHEIQNLGFDIDDTDTHTIHPAIITVRLSATLNSVNVGRWLEEKNIYVNYNSDYLIQHNTIQICLFSDIEYEDIDYFIQTLKHLTKNEISYSAQFSKAR
jgi:aspartate aminotransferase-like enzyme